MLARLDIVKQRFDEVSDLIIQPNIIADQKRYVQLTKEYKDLKQLMDKREEYIIVTGNIAEAEEIIKDGSDEEMTEMARLQLEEARRDFLNWRRKSSSYSFLRILKIVKMQLWKSVQEQEGMRRLSLQEISIVCIISTAKTGVGVFL